MLFLLIILIVIAFGFLIFMLLEAKQNNLLKYYFTFKTFPKNQQPLSLFFISDIHRRKISEKLLHQIRGHADFVVIGGDIMEKGVPLKRVEQNLDLLSKIGPLFFVWGNHDHEVDEEALLDLLLKKRVTVLVNSSQTIRPNVHFVGVDDATYERDDLEKALSNCPKEGFRILLSHNPCIRGKIKAEDQFSLVLSGHTHGGQIRLFGWGIREKGGIKKLENGILIISNGYGTTRYPLRFGAPPDTLLLTLSQPT